MLSSYTYTYRYPQKKDSQTNRWQSGAGQSPGNPGTKITFKRIKVNQRSKTYTQGATPTVLKK